MHQQFLEEGEHPYRVQVDEEVRYAGVDVGIPCLHLCEPVLYHLRGAVGEVFAESLQRRALCLEEQDVQQITVPIDEVDVFVDACAQVSFGFHQQDILALHPVVALQYGVESGEDRAEQGAEEVIFAGEVMVEIAHGNACLCGHLAHGGLGKAVSGKLLSGHVQNPASYVSFQYLHRV